MKIKNKKTKHQEILDSYHLLIKQQNKKMDETNPVALSDEFDDKFHEKIDHYHGEHHFDKDGNHDHYTKEDFLARHHFIFSKRAFIFKIILTACFLALSFVMIGIDFFIEFIQFPVTDNVWIVSSFMNMFLVALSVSALGVSFSLIVAGLTPIFHNAIEGFRHGYGTLGTDILTNVFLVLVIFFVYYLAFKNSTYHRDDNKKIFNIKRWAPIPIIVLIMGFIYTCLFIIFLETTSTGPLSKAELDSNILPMHGDHHHGGLHADDINLIILLIIYGWQIVRFGLAMILFAWIEPSIRILNHKYR